MISKNYYSFRNFYSFDFKVDGTKPAHLEGKKISIFILRRKLWKTKYLYIYDL